jgi:hypothetical protein
VSGGLSPFLHITDAGNVGIGTTSPNIYNTTNTRNLTVVSDAGYGIVSAVGLVGTGGEIDLGSTTIRHAAIASLDGSNLGFYTNGTNSGTGVTERMRITSGGDLLVGTTSNFSQEAAANLALSVKNSASKWGINMQADASGAFRAITFYNSAGTSQGYISVNGTGTTTYSTTSSDIRLKQNIEDWNENVLDSFTTIEPKTFEFIGYENPETQKGFIAQDMVDSFPEAYPVDEKGFYAFNPSGMVVYLMKAIQELKTEIDSLKNQIK